MARLLFPGASCWRCHKKDIYLFEVDGQLPEGPVLNLCCKPCIEDLIDARRRDEALRARGRRRRRSPLPRDRLLVESVAVEVQGEEPRVLMYGSEALTDWLDEDDLAPLCILCTASPAYHIYESIGDRYPILTACRACIRQVLQTNQDPADPNQLFASVLRLRIGPSLEFMRWGSRALTEFLAADYPWAEAMGVHRNPFNPM